MAVEPLAKIIRVILQSVPDLANVVALILFFMLVSVSQAPAYLLPQTEPAGQWVGMDASKSKGLGLESLWVPGSIYWHSFARLIKLQGNWVRLGGLWPLWQVFSVFGVTLFGAFVPKHFQNMGVALYTLFICITQDGWLDIYSDFQ